MTYRWTSSAVPALLDGGRNFSSGTGVVSLLLFQSLTGAFAELAGFVVDVHVGDAVQHPGGVQGGLTTAGFFMNQEHAEGGGP